MKSVFRKLALLTALALCCGMLAGCRSAEKHTASYYDLFDTYCTLTIYGVSQEEFDRVSEDLYAFLLDFHQQTDIYHSYEGMTNLYDINEAAGSGKMLTVSETLMDFLCFAKDAESLSQHKVNVMIGAVTSLWHAGRLEGVVPSQQALQEAAEHTDIESLLLDEASCTVQICDAQALLDVGALAKGYAGRLASAYLKSQGITDFLLDLGGNICAFGSPLGTGRDQFLIGIQDPDAQEGVYAQTVQIQNEAIVTSGDYQRYYTVDGVRYHHIIDPDTLQPAQYHRSVTVICGDSALADLLSTALFLMPEEEGRALAESMGAQVIYLPQ